MSNYVEVFGVHTELPLTKQNLGFLAHAEYSLRLANQVYPDLPKSVQRQRQAHLKQIESSLHRLIDYLGDNQALIDFYHATYRGILVNYLEKPCFQYFGYWVRTPFNNEFLMLLAQGNLKNKRLSRGVLYELAQETPNGFDDLEMLIDQDNQLSMQEFRHLIGTLHLTATTPEEAEKLEQELVAHYRALIPIYNRHICTEMYCHIIPDWIISVAINLVFLLLVLFILHASHFAGFISQSLFSLLSFV